MRKFNILTVLIVAVVTMVACQQQQHQDQQVHQQQSSAYVPGIGDLMGGLQLHHNKLWFAGINENWRLAEFALHELEETVEDLETFHANRDELKTLAMIYPSLELMHKHIDNQNLEEFKRGYVLLTGTCNACHDASGFDYIEIATPTSPAFTNQVY